MDNLLEYRRQFLLSRAPLPFPSAWKRLPLGPYWLQVHPDLEVCHVEDEKTSLTLLGNLYSPDEPEKRTGDIVKDLFVRVDGQKSLFSSIKRCVGRYALLYRDAERSIILNDPLSLREIYYCCKDNLVICGSQPNLLAKFARPEIKPRRDPDFLEYYARHSRNSKWNPYCKWIGDETYYESIKHLLPNHYLDIKKYEARRYWPNAPIKTLTLDEAVDQGCSFLQNSVRAVANRHSIMMAVTAGVDSRTLLAATHGIEDKVYYFINDNQLGPDHPDISIPANIFKDLGIPFHIHDVPAEVDDEFRSIFLNNTFFSSDRILPAIYNVYFKNHAEKINVLGIGEIGRTRFGKEPRKLNAYRIAYMMKYKSGRYVLGQAEKILAELRPVAGEYGVNPLTLLYWEHWLGNWGTTGNSESDIAIEEINPYDSHALYEIFLGVDKKFAKYHDPRIFKAMIRKMWPALAKWPINPPHGTHDKILYDLKKIGIYPIFKEIKYRWNDIRHRGFGGRQ